MALILTIGGTIAGYVAPVQAESPASAPEDLIQTIDRLETAANDRNLEGLMDLYASNFEHDDGLNRRDLRNAITEFWNRYSTLNYDIELIDWEETATGYTTETEITITGQTAGDQPYRLQSVLRSRQTLAHNRLVHQTTLEEASTLSSGQSPPTVRVQLPEGVAPGDRFEFDAIVLEPLGNTFLLGGVLEEAVDVALDRDPAFIELQPL
ncbi:MAG: nuclear transport factor 2 family protein, partial [Oscillatoriales cyanobacterium]